MLSIKQLSFAYDKKNVLEEISFDIDSGDFCAIIGPNGSGKSTLLKAIAGILPTKVAGSVYLQDTAIEKFSARELAKIVSYVPQKQDVVFDFSVFDTILMGRNPYQNRWEGGNAQDHEIVMDVMSKTHLTNLKDRMLGQLSGGEMQRVMIARAMAQQTPLMLLDEPLSNLDIAHKYEVMDILQHLNRQSHTTILIILHDFSFVKQYTSKSILIQNGKLQMFSSTDEVLTSNNIRSAFDLSSDYQIDGMGNIYRN